MHPVPNHRQHELPREGTHSALRQAQGNPLAPSAKPQDNTKSGPRAEKHETLGKREKMEASPIPDWFLLSRVFAQIDEKHIKRFVFPFFFAKRN